MDKKKIKLLNMISFFLCLMGLLTILIQFKLTKVTIIIIVLISCSYTINEYVQKKLTE